MSHNIEYGVFPENCNRKKVEQGYDNYVAHADWQEGASGLPDHIRWKESAGIFDNEEKARAYIEKIDSHNYDQIAVRFYQNSELKESAKLKELKEKYADASKKYRALEDTSYFSTITSKMVACKNCESRFAREEVLKHYPKINRCLVCNCEMRPQSMLDRIDRAWKAYTELGNKVKAETEACELKQRKSAKVMWLVKIEYHT